MTKRSFEGENNFPGQSQLLQTVVQVIVGGGIVFALGIWLGKIGAGYLS